MLAVLQQDRYRTNYVEREISYLKSVAWKTFKSRIEFRRKKNARSHSFHDSTRFDSALSNRRVCHMQCHILSGAVATYAFDFLENHQGDEIIETITIWQITSRTIIFTRSDDNAFAIEWQKFLLLLFIHCTFICPPTQKETMARIIFQLTYDFLGFFFHSFLNGIVTHSLHCIAFRGGALIDKQARNTFFVVRLHRDSFYS